MIISRNAITNRQLERLLAFARSKECKFLLRVNPPSVHTSGVEIIKSSFFDEVSVISFLEIKEAWYQTATSNGVEITTKDRFFVKLCIEDRFWEESTLSAEERVEKKSSHYLSGTVPASISEKVLEILNT